MAYALAAIVLIAIVSMARGFARAWRADEMAHLRAEKQQFKEARSLDRVVLNDGGNMNGDALEELDEQGDEIARLRDENCLLKDAIRRLADQDATLSVCDGNVTVSMDAMLTNAEREGDCGCSRQVRRRNNAEGSRVHRHDAGAAGADEVRTRKLSGGPWPSAPAPGSPTPSRGGTLLFLGKYGGRKKSFSGACLPSYDRYT